MTGTTPRLRPSGRVLAIDEQERLLLVGVRRRDRPVAWITPGGATDPGESHVEAARREMREETGLQLAPSDLLGPVAVQRGTFVERGITYQGDDLFYLARVPSFAPDTSGLMADERDVVVAVHWWALPEIDAASDVVFPPGVADLVRTLLSDGIPSEPPTLPPRLPW